jgi:hypothetical protein
VETLLLDSYTTRYFGSSVGSDYFWCEKDVSPNVEMSLLVRHEAIEHEGFNNICKI